MSRLRKLRADRSGSEAVEAVYACIALCFLIMSVLLILGYAVQANAVSYAAKRVTRQIEVTGQANEEAMNRLVREFLPNYDKIGGFVEVTDVNYVNSAKRTIQLRERFIVHIRAYYTVKVATPAFASTPLELKLPINVYVEGQSEIYWKT